MLACTFVHRKFLGRTPYGKVVLRAFLGGTKNEALLAETDEALVATVRRELSEILGEKVLPLKPSRSIPRSPAGARPWPSTPSATRSASSAFSTGWQPSPACAWPAMPTTASASPTASA